MGCGASTGTTQEDNINNSGGANPAGSEPRSTEKQVPPAANKLPETKTGSQDDGSQVDSKTKESNSATQKSESDTNNVIRSTEKSANKTFGDQSHVKTGVKETETSQDKKGETSQEKQSEINSGKKVETSQDNNAEDQALDKIETKKHADSTKDEAIAGKSGSGERMIPEEPKDQKKFDVALKSACLLLKPESVLRNVTKNVTKLHLSRALPLHFSLKGLLAKFENLKDLDISNNNLGPQAFRAVCLAMCNNSTVFSLNLAGNRSDTDSAECLGKMVTENQVLQYLDVSSNYLGKDFFSRQVGQALKVNSTLKTLRCESIGSTDARVLIEGLQANSSITDFDFSSNEISDKLGFAKGLAESLKKPPCCLHSVALGRCGINSAGMEEIMKGLGMNQSLTELNLNGSEFKSLGSLVSFIVTAVKHSGLRNLSLDNCSIKSQETQTDSISCDRVSSLEVLSLNSCTISDAFLAELSKHTQGKLLSLAEIDLTANDGLSPACLDQLVKMTSAEDMPGSLMKLKYGLNKAEGIAEKVESFPALQYLNLRMCRISATDVGSLGKLLGRAVSLLSNVILDGLKLSGTQAIKELLENAKAGPLSTLSLGSCSLDDNDVSLLCESIKTGLQLHMLKLSANRITDVGVTALVEAVLKNKTHPLGVLDLSNNRIEDSGAKTLVKMLTGKSKLQSLNVSCNNIGKDGLSALTTAIGAKSTLCTLYAQGQRIKLDECHVVEVFQKLATSLGFKIQQDGDRIKSGCCDLPSTIPEGLLVNLTDLGGNSGNVGQAIDCPAIKTDYTQDRLPSLSLSHIMEICSSLKGSGEGQCVWSDKEWAMITGSDRPTTETPSWLKVSSQRDLALYLSNLPGNTTQQKIEAILEMDADCNLDEVCLMKDPVTRSINGTGWAVMVDEVSVQKGINYFNSGEAKIFGQAFMMSRLNVKVDDTANAEVEKKAEDDRILRHKQRQADDAAHRTLIVNTAEESWKRHAYRLAHPAYADGRVW